MSPSDIAALLSIIAFAVSAAIGVATFLARRRGATGRIGTSEASVLWQQAQDMRVMLLAEKTKAEEQRDRLIGAYTDQVVPLLTSINRLVTDLTGAVSANNLMLRQLAATRAPEGGDPDRAPQTQ